MVDITKAKKGAIVLFRSGRRMTVESCDVMTSMCEIFFVGVPFPSTWYPNGKYMEHAAHDADIVSIELPVEGKGTRSGSRSPGPSRGTKGETS